MRTNLTVFLVLICLSTIAYAEEVRTIELQKSGGRTEALVVGEEKVQEIPTTFIGKSFYNLETGIVKSAQFVSSMVGKATDSTVWGMQKASNVLIAPIVKTLDVKQWGQKN